MDLSSDKKQVTRELLVFSLLQLGLIGLMFGVYAMLHKFSTKVVLGGIFGAALAILNYFLMAVGVFRAADKAEKGDVKGGQREISRSMTIRYLLLILLLFAGAKSGWFDVVAMLVPVAMMRMLIMIGEFFRRKDG